jgi:glucose dehydrogenase
VQTGKPLWHRHLSATKTLGVDIQPTVIDGVVLASTVPVSISGIYAPGDRGTIYALDAATGAIRWSFDTVQGDLWGHPDVNSGGGSWYPPAIDATRHTVYFGTANPAPFPGTAMYPNGTSRPGANLYTDSLVALDLTTGKLRWYHQVTAHDLYDRDQVHAMLAHIAGGREVVVSAGKSGEIVGLDPDTGRVLWQRPVGKHRHDTDPTLHGPTEVYPGTYGGVETPPATADGVAYIPTLNSPTKLEPNKTSYFGSQLGTGNGEVVAIDAANGRVVWDTVVPGDPLGGATVVNDLVFTALLDGTIVGLRRDTGSIVWKYKADGGINGWLSATADTLYVPVGQSSPPQILALRLSAL